MRYRLYIDEVGNHDMNHVEQRYLSLTGIILNFEAVRDNIHVEFERLKRFFGSHPDEPVIFHRKEMIQRRGAFRTLNNPQIEADFNAEFLQRLQTWDFTVITVTIDKAEHKSLYGDSHKHPYHYCLEVMLERYVRWLETAEMTGDVLAEGRGKVEDTELKRAYQKFYEYGSRFVDSPQIKSCLTTNELKIKTKDRNICGLQLADLLAYPSYRASLADRKIQSLNTDFSSQELRFLNRNIIEVRWEKLRVGDGNGSHK